MCVIRRSHQGFVLTIRVIHRRVDALQSNTPELQQAAGRRFREFCCTADRARVSRQTQTQHLRDLFLHRSGVFSRQRCSLIVHYPPRLGVQLTWTWSSRQCGIMGDVVFMVNQPIEFYSCLRSSLSDSLQEVTASSKLLESSDLFGIM